MAKIRNAKPKQSGGGYDRLVGNHDMAEIFTKAQSTVISNGTELEKIIRDYLKSHDPPDAATVKHISYSMLSQSGLAGRMNVR